MFSESVRDCAIIIRRGEGRKIIHTIPPSQQRQISSDPLQISQKLCLAELVLGDLLNSKCFIGEAEALVEEFLSSTS